MRRYKMKTIDHQLNRLMTKQKDKHFKKIVIKLISRLSLFLAIDCTHPFIIEKKLIIFYYYSNCRYHNIGNLFPHIFPF